MSAEPSRLDCIGFLGWLLGHRFKADGVRSDWCRRCGFRPRCPRCGLVAGAAARSSVVVRPGMADRCSTTTKEMS